MKKIILVLFIFFASAIYSEDLPHSVGPAPQSDIQVNPEPVPFAVGTRAFHIISSTPTFRLANSFMETCNTTLFGAPFTMTFPGGLVYRNGILYIWNQTAPFQLYSIDTVTGMTTYLTNITGIPHPYLTGICWDGTNTYAVSTNLSTSQLLNFNTSSGVCTPIGAPSSVCPGAITLFGRMYAGSRLYSYDMVNDDLYRWNKTTGTATLLGSAGFSINIGVGASFDGNTCYINANNQLKRWDTTGAGANICTYSAMPIGIACIPSIPPNPLYPTICRNGINIPVPNGNIPRRDTIRMIGNNSCPLTDINVKIDTFLHTWISDMLFSLTHNGATNVNLFLNRGGSGDNIMGCIFNDSAANPISAGTPPFTGQWRPEQPLNAYNGQMVSGNWILVMTDQFNGDLGFLRGWCIQFQFTCPTGGVQTVEVPFTYRLSQNYPNPFNPVTTIKYGLPKYGKTSLVIYDVTGKVVTKLVDNELIDAGTYEVRWDASNYSSGIYFYTLESGNYKDSKKMILTK